MFDITGDSAQAVAYRLMLDIKDSENKTFSKVANKEIADREWIISTYAECLKMINDPFQRANK